MIFTFLLRCIHLEKDSVEKENIMNRSLLGGARDQISALWQVMQMSSINLIEALETLSPSRIVKTGTFGSDNSIHYILLADKTIVCFGQLDAGSVSPVSYKAVLTPVFPFTFSLLSIFCSFNSPSGYRSTNAHEPQVRSSTMFTSDKQFQFIVTSGASYSQPYLDCLVSYCMIGQVDQENYNSLLDSQ